MTDDDAPKPAAIDPVVADSAPAPAVSEPMPAAEPPGYAGHPVEHPNRTPLIAAVIFAGIVVIGGYFLWRQGAAASGQTAQLQDQISQLNQRVATLQSQQPNLQPLQAQLQSMAQRLDALEKNPPGQQQEQALAARMDRLEKNPPVAQLDQAGQQQIAALASRVDGITARQNQLGVQEKNDTDKLASQITDLGNKLDAQVASLDKRVTEAAKAGPEISAINARSQRLAQLQAAQAALDAGHPLGQIDNAPPALAAFATKPPPTEASLRLSFDQAANAARQSGQPAQVAHEPFLARLWDRAQSGVVVREGDRVIVGDAVSGILDHAKQLLDAGDLAGAVKALDGLAGPAAQAMAPWRAQAQSLLDARAALITAAKA